MTSVSLLLHPVAEIMIGQTCTMLAESTVRMYYRSLRSGTGRMLLQSSGHILYCIHQGAALFCVKWRSGCRLEIMTSSQKLVDAYLHEELSCQIVPQYVL